MKVDERLREALKRVIGLNDDDDDDHDHDYGDRDRNESVSVGELLARGREEKVVISAMAALGRIRPRCASEARLLDALNKVPNRVALDPGNSAVVESLRQFSTPRQPLLLVSEGDCAEGLRRAGNLAIHIPGIRTTREIRKWLDDIAVVVSGIYVLISNIDVSVWQAVRLALARRGSGDGFIAYWPSRQSTMPASLESALNRAISCSLVPSYQDVQALEESEALALLFIDRFADDLKKGANFIGRIARLAAPRNSAFKQALFKKCLALRGLPNDELATALRHAEQTFARRKFSKVVQAALTV
jgi:hypothetical protein